MRFVGFNGGRLGVLSDAPGSGVVDITDLSGVAADFWPPIGMVRFIGTFDREKVEAAIVSRPALPLETVRLDAPIRWPNKVVAFPANYHAHIDEMRDRGKLISRTDARGQGFFLKASSSLSGPSDPIRLPQIADREIHHEGELGIVIGRRGRNVGAADAAGYIFGFTCLLDMVVRGQEERVMRKSFDSFCPIGPWIAEAAAVSDWNNLAMTLSVNGDRRQQANTCDLIVGIGEMVAMASSVMTLEPGDIIASGTPAGVGPVQPGDVVEIEIEGVGGMRLDVVGDSGGGHALWQAARQQATGTGA